jgi:hypothetical protein
MDHHAFLLSSKMALPPHPPSANAAIFATSLSSVLVFILISWQVGSLPILAEAEGGGWSKFKRQKYLAFFIY